MEKISVCGMNLKDYLIEMEEFHGDRSPGMLVGAVLLDAAMARMKQTEALGVVAETINCLPDAVQLLTPVRWAMDGSAFSTGASLPSPPMTERLSKGSGHGWWPRQYRTGPRSINGSTAPIP